jgi:hypothetical protein
MPALGAFVQMRTLQVIYWTVTGLLVANAILYFTFSISLAGYVSDKALFWTWFVLTHNNNFNQF